MPKENPIRGRIQRICIGAGSLVVGSNPRVVPASVYTVAPKPYPGLQEESYRRDSSLSVPAARDHTPVNFLQYFEVTFPRVFLLAFGTSRQSHALEFPGVRPGPLDLAR